MSDWEMIGRLAIALALAGAIGLERELRSKDAGLRTHALVGLGSALIIEVSAYGFNDVLLQGKIQLDPSRVAAQVVSGVGFIGAGLIFVRQDYVRGLTTAASIWLVAAIGLAAGAGMWQIAVATTLLGLVVVAGLEQVEVMLRPKTLPMHLLNVRFVDSEDDVLRRIIAMCEEGEGSSIESLRLAEASGSPAAVELRIQLLSQSTHAELARRLSQLKGVLEVSTQTP